MKALIIDTAGEYVRVALADGSAGDSLTVPNGRASATLLTAVDELLRRNSLALSDMDAVGAVVGPGSFTGIRIGLSTVKAWAFALGLPVFAVNSLRTLAYNRYDERCFVVTDAGNGYSYVAMYHGGKELLAPRCIKTNELGEFADTNGGIADISYDDCSGLIRAAEECLQKGALMSGERLEALYIRKHQTEQ